MLYIALGCLSGILGTTVSILIRMELAQSVTKLLFGNPQLFIILIFLLSLMIAVLVKRLIFISSTIYFSHALSHSFLAMFRYCLLITILLLLFPISFCDEIAPINNGDWFSPQS